MNVHVTSWSPRLCSDRLWGNQKRAIKMITETQQILACCQKEFFGFVTIRKVDKQSFYSAPEERMNHPVIRNWARKNIKHMVWLYYYLFELYQEYRRRFPKGKGFSNVMDNIKILQLQLMDHNLTEEELSNLDFYNFAKADDKDLDFTHIEDVFTAYDLYLQAQGN